MTKKDIEIKRKEVISRLNEVLDNYKWVILCKLGNLEKKCYDFDMEFPSESD